MTKDQKKIKAAYDALNNVIDQDCDEVIHFSEALTMRMSEVLVNLDICKDEPADVFNFSGKFGNANLAVSGYFHGVTEDGADSADDLDLYVTVPFTEKTEDVPVLTSRDVNRRFNALVQFIKKCQDPKFLAILASSSSQSELARLINRRWNHLKMITCCLVTNGQAELKTADTYFANDETAIPGKVLNFYVMDLDRYDREVNHPAPKTIEVDFINGYHDALPCVYSENSKRTYEYALAIIPGDVLYNIYSHYSTQILQENVRAFLSQKGKVNQGIRDTILQEPDKFMAYNNGLVIVADDIDFKRDERNTPVGINKITGFQVVNGGQTVSSIFFTKKNGTNEDVDLSDIFVAAKIVHPYKTENESDREELIGNISQYANTQNKISASDLYSRSSLHQQLEDAAKDAYLSNGGQWFYERAKGSYDAYFRKNGKTPAKLKKLNELMPKERMLTKTAFTKAMSIWMGYPQKASLGGEKNFVWFMKELANHESFRNIDRKVFQGLVAKVIICKAVEKRIRQLKPYGANIQAYTSALFAEKYGDSVDLNKVWNNQLRWKYGVSDGLADCFFELGARVQEALMKTGEGKNITEWAKKDDCLKQLRELVSFDGIDFASCEELKG